MATNNLQTVLEKENLKPGQLAQAAKISKATVMKVSARKRSVAPSTEDRMVTTLNWLSKKSYAVTDVFPKRAK